MELKEAVRILEYHNEWRRDNSLTPDQMPMVNPTKLGIAIDTVVKFIKEVEKKNNVVVG